MGLYYGIATNVRLADITEGQVITKGARVATVICILRSDEPYAVLVMDSYGHRSQIPISSLHTWSAY